MKTLFRADSSSTIGLGHIKRDLVYATRLHGEDISFACVENAVDLPYPLHHLSSNSVDELIELCLTEKVEHLIIDHYGINYADEKKLKETLKIQLSVFDDSYEKHYCDEIINHNISADPSRYILEPFTRLSIIEPLIRQEFKSIVRRDRNHKSNEVMIAMGGVDSANLTPKIIPLCTEYEHIHVITSHINPHLQELRSIPHIQLHVDTDHMAEIMNRCDLAIITPSLIVHEALYMQLPFIAIKTASNQEDLYHFLKHKGYPLLDQFDTTELKTLIDHERQMPPFIPFAIRKTQDEDMMALFDLANDPRVRAASLSSDPIDLATHKTWFAQAMADPKQLLFTLLDGRGNFLGQLRFDLRRENEALLSISLVSGARGFSLAQDILSKGLGIISKLHPDRQVIAQIKKENIPSIKSFEKAGFSRYKEEDTIFYYHYRKEG